MNKTINDHGKEVYTDVVEDDAFSVDLFHVVVPTPDDHVQFALHTNLGSITVLDRMTGFGWRDVETGYRSRDGKFWLASGNCDIRNSGVTTIGEAIQWIKDNANTCIAS